MCQDNPVGVGYSYVEDDSLLVTTDLEAAADMITLLKALVKEVKTLESSPLFLVGESYGGKYAATLGVSIVRAVRAGDLKLTLGGVALGDSWISPEDFAVKKIPILLPLHLSCPKYRYRSVCIAVFLRDTSVRGVEAGQQRRGPRKQVGT
jgi:carboxypeptidase C (cathepsin A)